MYESKGFGHFSVGTGTKENESNTGRLWAARFHHVTACSHLAHVSLLTNFISSFSIF
jgi:hypothetical protein